MNFLWMMLTFPLDYSPLTRRQGMQCMGGRAAEVVAALQPGCEEMERE